MQLRLFTYLDGYRHSVVGPGHEIEIALLVLVDAVLRSQTWLLIERAIMWPLKPVLFLPNSEFFNLRLLKYVMQLWLAL